MRAIYGKKLAMSQTFFKDGERVPVTKISAGPCLVAFQRTLAKDGYRSLGLSYQAGFSKKNGGKILREVRIEEGEELPVNEQVKVDKCFSPGDLVDVTGVSKGWGFAGVVKRHHFKGGPRTHGQSDRERAPGSIGSSTTPGRVMKGKRMAGKEGTKKKTIKNLLVVKVDPAKNELWLKGAVPGKAKGLLLIKNTGVKAKLVKELV